MFEDEKKVTQVFICLLSESESVQGLAVLLDNVAEDMSRDLLSMLVENISSLDESSYSLEIIWEINRAVITFDSPAGKKEPDTAVNTQIHRTTVKTCCSLTTSRPMLSLLMK